MCVNNGVARVRISPSYLEHNHSSGDRHSVQWLWWCIDFDERLVGEEKHKGTSGSCGSFSCGGVCVDDDCDGDE